MGLSEAEQDDRTAADHASASSQEAVQDITKECSTREIEVSAICDPEVGLYGFRAIADKVPGSDKLVPYPPLGGTRNTSYAELDDACIDAMGLAEGMLYKNIAASLKLSGAKTALNTPDKLEGKLREKYFEAYGRQHALLNKQRILNLKIPSVTAEDSGVSAKDLQSVQKGAATIDLIEVLDQVRSKMHPEVQAATRSLLENCPQCIVGMKQPGKSGNPSPLTALGVFEGGKLLAELHLRRQDLKDVRVAIKGIAGQVGFTLAKLYVTAGAQVFGSDIIFEWSNKDLRADQVERRREVRAWMDEKGVEEVKSDKTHLVEGLKIYAPCALSRDITPEMLVELPEGIVIAGAANIPIKGGQATEVALAKKNIYAAPHFIINSGGVINVYQDLFPENYDTEIARRFVREKVKTGLSNNYQVFSREGNKLTTTEIARGLAVDKMKKVGINI